MDDLIERVKKVGIIHPIIVRPKIMGIMKLLQVIEEKWQGN